MLVSLTVQNFAIIDNIQIDFDKGMSVLTGETGAGKSLIIDAIGLLFGKRASNEMIRHTENKAVVEGVFSNICNDLSDLLNELGIELNDDYLIIKREIYENGKSISRVNNTVVTLNQLTSISEYLGDIHSQNDTFGLINPKNYLRFITNKDIDDCLLIYKEEYKDYQSKNKEYNTLLERSVSTKEKEEFLRYQLNEINRLNISVEEEAELKKELDIISNKEDVVNNIANIIETFDDTNILDALYSISLNFEKLSKYDDNYKQLQKQVLESYYSLQEVRDNKNMKISYGEMDLDKIDDINSRLAVYSDLKRKYKKSTPEIIEYFNETKKEVDLIENFDFILEKLQKVKLEAFNKVLATGKKLSDLRRQASIEISSEIKKHLQDLHIKNAQFEIQFINPNQDDLRIDGIDVIDFMVSFNKGEPLKPLSKSLSGGEMSRFMLALKTVIEDNVFLSTKIFDEIDNGVSGSVAYSIGEKIKSISKNSQVLCITHLPQVAAISNEHYRISKYIQDNKTYTKVHKLSYEERIVEIASMISNGSPSKTSLDLAKELLDNYS